VEHDSAIGGAEALTALRHAARRNKPYRVAILDRWMPEMDGLQLAAAIRADADIAGLMLVMLSSVGDDGDSTQWRQVGIEAYLTKPWRQSELYNCLVAVMGRTGHGWAEPVEPTPTAVAAEVGGGRILLAEDNPVNQEVALGMLEVLGCMVQVVENGQQAVGALSSGGYDVVLMDCHMPEMDGFQATAEIRRREQRQADGARQPIVALTANALQGDRERCLAAGMDDYLSKPFTQEQLRAVLARWLTHRRGAPEPEEVARSLERPVEPPEAVPTAGTVLDEGALDQIRALQRPGRPSVLEKVVKLYLDDSLKLVEALRQAVHQGDAQAVQQAAHTLKSSSANLGATELATLCRELESLGRQGCLEPAAALMQQLETTYPGVRQALAGVATGEPV
jgi:CheY-like chemotaxis protein/HPt (histidine-containing phosphotransfer) domain-containing protein